MSLDSLKQEASSLNTSPERLRELAAINDELARLVAANYCADSSLLEQLAVKARTDKDIKINKALASNPNTPTKRLIALAPEFPEEVFSNPVYSLLILEDVSVAHRFNQKMLLKLVCASNTPTSFLESAANVAEVNIQRFRNEKYFPYLSLKQQCKISLEPQQRTYYFDQFWKWRELLIAIAVHQNTSKEKLLSLSISGEDIVAEFAQLRLNNLLDDRRFWDEVVSYKRINLMLFVPHKLLFQYFESPDLSTKLLQAASKLDTIPGILNIVANHRNTSKEILDNLVKSSISFVAEAAKLHVNYTEESEIEWRERAKSKIDRMQLPTFPNTEEKIELQLWYAGIIQQKDLFYLNQDSIQAQTNTLLRIICSTDTPQSILDDLEKHPEVSQLTNECITYLKHQDAIIFESIPQTLQGNGDSLSSNSAYQINTVIRDLNTLLIKLEDKYWLRQRRKYVGIKKPARHICIIDLIQKSMRSRTRKYRLQEILNNFDKGRYNDYYPLQTNFSNLEYYGVILANYPDTSPRILSELAEHPIAGVRVLVASHHDITQNSLTKLISDRTPEVRAAVLANPKLDLTFKAQLASLENPNLSHADLLELSNSRYSPIRVKVAQHPDVDESILTKLSNDKLIVKLAVAKNVKTPADILTRFTQHPDRRFHLAVAQNSGAPIDLLMNLAIKPVDRRGGFHLTPVKLAAIKSILIQDSEAAVPLLDRCLKFPDRPSFARFLVLMSPNAPKSFLARYYKSWFWVERYAIAQNPNTDSHIRQQLTQDPNILVRAAARDVGAITTPLDSTNQ